MNPESGRFAGLVVMAALLLLLVAGGSRAYRYGGLSALVGFGCYSESICFARDNQAALPLDAVVYQSGGYDGQFFYYIAAERYGGPAAVLDSEAFRRARIGYPLLAGPAYLLGSEALVLWMSLLLLLAHLGAILVLHRYLGRSPARRSSDTAAAVVPHGRLTIWLFALNPFSLYCFVLSVADGLALSLAVVAAVWFRAADGRRSSDMQATGVAALAALALALLTKETFLVAPVALGVSLLAGWGRGVSELRQRPE